MHIFVWVAILNFIYLEWSSSTFINETLYIHTKKVTSQHTLITVYISIIAHITYYTYTSLFS